MKKILCVLTTLLSLSGCGGIQGEKYRHETPSFDLKSYFEGPIKGWGIVQNRKGDVVMRFDVDMHGSWKGNEGTLVEDFVYYDGKKQQRIWHITDLGNGKYTGRADDILNIAQGTNFGNAGQWQYVMDVPVGDKSYRMAFNDWMWQMNDGVLMNRSYMKKFNLTMAEITIFMQKQDSKKQSGPHKNDK